MLPYSLLFPPLFFILNFFFLSFIFFTLLALCFDFIMNLWESTSLITWCRARSGHQDIKILNQQPKAPQLLAAATFGLAVKIFKYHISKESSRRADQCGKSTLLIWGHFHGKIPPTRGQILDILFIVTFGIFMVTGLSDEISIVS